MESLKKLYKIGRGPSSSHTMGPTYASIEFLKRNKDATSFEVIIYGSLAKTGMGHYIDVAILDVLGKDKCKLIFDYETKFDYHPNGMKFKAFINNKQVDEWIVFSVGGGTLKELNEPREEFIDNTYPHNTMDEILKYCKDNNLTILDYVKKYENDDIISYMNNIYTQMVDSIKTGLSMSGFFNTSLRVERKAKIFYEEYKRSKRQTVLIQACALAVSEVNASSGIVVTAPTCGSCGVVPSILYSEEVCNNVSRNEIINALLVGGLFGNIVKTNASISGAEVGCQGEIGVACSMASAMKAYLMGGSNEVIEYASEIALEHHLGMTCDPVDGLVMIPCIERNAISAVKALNTAQYAYIAGGSHYISFDHIVNVMKETGHDLSDNYKETSIGGLAKISYDNK